MRVIALPGVPVPASRLGVGIDAARLGRHFAALLDRFVERGGNVLETARAYGGGRCEQALGEWLATRGERHKLVVISKGAHTPRCNPVDLSKEIEQSQAALKLDQIDVYLMHRDNADVPVGEFVDVLNEHFQAGRMRAFGVSNWTIERLEAANQYAEQRGLEPIRVSSNHLSLARMVSEPWPGCRASWDPEERAYLTARHIPLIAWSAGARGFFARSDDHVDTNASSAVLAWHSTDNLERKRRARELAARRGVTPTAISVAYVLNQPFPTLALIGPNTLDELEESLRCVEVQLSPEEMAWLDLSLDQAPSSP